MLNHSSNLVIFSIFTQIYTQLQALFSNCQRIGSLRIRTELSSIVSAEP